MSEDETKRKELLRRLEELIKEGEDLKSALDGLEGIVIEAITKSVKKGLEERAREEGRPISEEEVKRVSRRSLALLKDLGRIVDKLVEELKSYRDDEEKRAMLGEELDLPENKVFSTCLSVLARTEALWLGLSPATTPAEAAGAVAEVRLNVGKAIPGIGSWVARCIRWAKEALPPTKPFHDVLMETEATLAEALLLVLVREEKDMLKALRG